MLLPPRPDPTLDVFRGGVAVLRSSGALAGHVASEVSPFWAPLSLSRRQQWAVWYLVVWADGTREPLQEDYPPWSIVTELREGRLTWDDDRHAGTYDAEWAPPDEAAAIRSRLGIRPEDF